MTSAADSSPAPRATGNSLRNDRLFITLALVAVVLAFAQLTLGGVVRVTGSGDGCPDWPQCFGSWVPPWDDRYAITEWSHRTVGATYGLVVFALTAMAWLRHPSERGIAYTLTGATALITVVGGLGGAVVLNDLDPAIRTVHLMGAEFAIGLTALALVMITFQPRPAMDPGYRRVFRLSVSAAVLTLAALLTGAYSVWQGAGFVCGSWPLCGGSIIPDTSFQWIHMTHRLLAGLSALAVAYAAHRAYRLPGAPSALRWVSLAALAAITAQVLVGAANPWTQFAQWARAAHLSLATLVWLVMCLQMALVLRPERRTDGVVEETA
jgi:heme A synthase